MLYLLLTQHHKEISPKAKSEKRKKQVKSGPPGQSSKPRGWNRNTDYAGQGEVHLTSYTLLKKKAAPPFLLFFSLSLKKPFFILTRF